MKIPNIPCEEAAVNIEKSFWKQLNFIDWVKTRWHLFLCKNCSDYEKDSTVLHRLLCSLKKRDDSDNLSEADKIRLKESLNH
jgi:hypothetical protein|tara:strand:- start:41401 stop:41646 length:246 start_codon:yes stop_codon:yes gene_type:complete